MLVGSWPRMNSTSSMGPPGITLILLSRSYRWGLKVTSCCLALSRPLLRLRPIGLALRAGTLSLRERDAHESNEVVNAIGDLIIRQAPEKQLSVRLGLEPVIEDRENSAVRFRADQSA